MLNYRSTIAFITITLVCFVIPETTFASDKRDDKIVVGVLSDNRHDEYGNFEAIYGISLDYLSNISHFLNLKLEIRHYQNIPELLGDVEANKIDGALGFSKTAEREKKFSFSAPIFSSTLAVWYRDAYLKNKNQQQLTWACVNKSVYCQLVEKRGAQQIYQAKSRDDAFEAVLQGKADALVTTYVSINEYLDHKDVMRGAVDVPSWLPEEKIRFISSKDNLELIKDIDSILLWEVEGRGIRSVASKNPYHVSDKLISQYKAHQNGKDVITYSSNGEAYPFLFENEKRQLDGMLVEYLALISARTGLGFNYVVPELNLESSYTSYNADIVPVLYRDRTKTKAAQWLITKPFMNASFTKVTHNKVSTPPKTDKQGILLSVSKQGIINVGEREDRNIARYRDMKDILDDLRSGEISAAYVPNDITYSMILNDSSEGLTFNKDEGITYSIAFAVSKKNVELKNVLNSIIDTVSVEEIEKLRRNYRKFDLVYGYDSSNVNKFAALASVVFVTLSYLGYLLLVNLRYKVKLAELNAGNEEKEKIWLSEIIQEINNIVFIHNEKNEILLSNCPKFQSNECQVCTMKSQASGASLVGNQIEIKTIIDGESLNDTHLAKDCRLDISHVHRESKTISSSNSDKRFILTSLLDVSAQKKRENALIKAEKEAKLAVEARENLLTTMSHELRTPLSAVHGLLDIIKINAVKDKDSHLVDQAIRSLDHLNKLVDGVLDLSKIESGVLSVKAEKVELLSLLCDVFRTFEPISKSNNLNYRVEIHPFAYRWVMVDGIRVSQILTNLLSNAVKFTSEGEISVVVEAVDNQLIVEITDTGIGMTPTQQQQVLKPFVQADDSITRHYGGTGLGLSIVDQLLQCMGGELNIESELNRGTTINVSIPFVRHDDDEGYSIRSLTYARDLPDNLKGWCNEWKLTESENTPDLNITQNSRSNLVSLTVRRGLNDQITIEQEQLKYPDSLLNLIVRPDEHTVNLLTPDAVSDWQYGDVLIAEDNPINQSVMTLQMNELGIKPVFVDTGLQAWDYINHNSIKVLLTDFHMPEMDGYELANKIKSSEQFKDIVVIGITAEDSRVAREKTKDIAIDDILYKPYSVSKLLDILEKHAMPAGRAPSWLERFKTNDAIAVANVFIDTMSEDVANFDFNSPTINRTIHRVKGALNAVGATEISKLCEDVECCELKANKEKLRKLVGAIESEIEFTKAWLKANEH
ncbi:transporter substrate-binding domain-containing protein [Vibrio gigantis]|uniref:ATP-binding protein n=1 Tax=Vibrio gigantis TaxID=296199 RepID=UPI003D10068F